MVGELFAPKSERATRVAQFAKLADSVQVVCKDPVVFSARNSKARRKGRKKWQQLRQTVLGKMLEEN